MLKKSIAAGTLAVGLVFAGAGAASAHECYIPNRSDAGNANATHSANWFAGSVTEFFGFAHEIFGGAPLTPEQIEWATAEAAAQGIPTSFTIFGKKLLPAGGGGPADGKGVDHLFEAYGAQLGAIYAAALAQ